MTEAELTFAKSFVEKAKWTEAKSYKKSPHAWTKPEDQTDPIRFKNLINDYGQDEVFGYRQTKFRYLYLDGYKYWYMTKTPNESGVINRAALGVADLVAEKYDSMFADEKYLKEDEALFKRIKSMIGNETHIIDLGCGTGLLLDHIAIPPDRYFGVDPSAKMIAVLNQKHPEYKEEVAVATATEIITSDVWMDEDRPPLLIVGLYAAPSYFKRSTALGMKEYMRPGDQLFLMFFAEDYYPTWCQTGELTISHSLYSVKELQEAYGENAVYQFGNYYTVKYTHR